MAESKGKTKEALGWLTADRELEAEGKAEQEAQDQPSEDHVSEKADEVRTKYGETPDGSDAPDQTH